MCGRQLRDKVEAENKGDAIIFLATVQYTSQSRQTRLVVTFTRSHLIFDNLDDITVSSMQFLPCKVMNLRKQKNLL